MGVLSCGCGRCVGSLELLHATKGNHLGVMEALLDTGMVGLNTAQDGLTPLLVAAVYGCLEAAALLIARGADVNRARPDGLTPLIHSSQEGRISIVELLLQAQAKIDHPWICGETALFLAAQNVPGQVSRFYLFCFCAINPGFLPGGNNPYFLKAEHEFDWPTSFNFN